MAAQILVDCASGGTKMYLALQRGEAAHVSNTEVGSMSPVYGSLQSARGSGTESTLIAEFRQNLEKAEACLSELAPDLSPQTVIIGLTAWWRQLNFSQRVEVYDCLLRHLHKLAEDIAPCRFEPLSDTMELTLERESVAYAARHNLGYADVDLVVSGGNTSINLVPAERYQTPASSVGLNIFLGQGVVQERGPEVWHSECFVQLDRAAGLFCKELAFGDAPDRITVVAIGSNYWGAKSAGLAETMQEHSLLDVLQQLQVRLEGQLSAHGEGWAKECANLIRLRTCLERLFPVNLHGIVSVVFARDWVIKGSPFRTTWTSGYFIRHAAPGSQVATPRQTRSAWIETADSAWMDLSSWKSPGFKNILCFDDVEDEELHEVPYSSRMRLINVISAKAFSRSAQPLAGVYWSRVALCPQPIGQESAGDPVGVQLFLPASDMLSRFVVVGLVSARSSGEDNAPGTLPRPALGFNRRLKDLFPVVDLGIVFDAKETMVTLQRGAVRMKSDIILGSRDVPWDTNAAATYHVWLEELDGKVYLRFAWNRRTPTSVKGAVEAWRYDIGKSELVLPAAIHVWVGLGGSPRVTRSTHNLGAASEAPSAGSLPSCAWSAVSFALLDHIPGGCGWASGRAKDSFARTAVRGRHCLYRYLPRWVARNFDPPHDGEEGVRRITVWPSHGQETENGICLVATAGEFDVWVFNDQGEGLYHCRFEKAKVWSVAILGVKSLSDTSGRGLQPGPAGGQGSCVEVRVLVGCSRGRHMLHEQLVTLDDPSRHGRCRLLERTAKVGEAEDSGGRWQGHTDAVTGIFVDHEQGLVYTVSYDKTAIQWNSSGEPLYQARGFHREKIYNGAFSPGGCWLATTGFDHVAIFSADAKQGLSCVALVDHDWDNPEIDRRWFAAAFLPQSLVPEPESTSELPSAMLTGDMTGSMWLVSLLNRDGSRRRPDGMTRFVSALKDGVSLEPHEDCVRQLCWVESESFVGLPSRPKTPSSKLRSSRCRCCRRSAVQDRRLSPHSGSPAASPELRLPLLCSTSSDRTVHVYDAESLLAARGALLAWQQAPGNFCTPRGSPGGAKPSARIWSLDEGRQPVAYAVDIVFHEAPVRAAGADAAGNLYTASRRLAKWDALPECTWGDRILQPKLLVREAFYLEVMFYFVNFLVFTLQLLYFSCNRGVFQLDSGAKTTVWPLATLTAVSVFEGWAFLPEMRPFWRTCVSLWSALMVVLCPSVLRVYYDAEIRYEIDANDHSNRNKQWWRKLRCYLFAFVFFGFLVIPTFREFAVLLYCPLDAAGVPRMAADPETVCFRGLHLAMTVACLVVGGLYLACGLLFETVNFDLSSLIESKLGPNAAFPTNRSTKSLGEDPIAQVSTRDISLPRLFYVMFRHLSPDVRLESTQVSTGAFTQTSWAAHSRHVRFLSKVLLAVVDQVSTEWVLWQMAAVAGIAVVNLLVNLVLPPLLATQLKWGIVTVEASIVAGTGVALFAMANRPSDTPPVIFAAIYMIVVICPFCIYVFGAPSLASLRRCCTSTSGKAVSPDATSPIHASSLHKASLAPGQQADVGRKSSVSAWG